MGFRVWGFWLRISGSGVGGWGVGFRVWVLGFKVWFMCLGLRPRLRGGSALLKLRRLPWARVVFSVYGLGFRA